WPRSGQGMQGRGNDRRRDPGLWLRRGYRTAVRGERRKRPCNCARTRRLYVSDRLRAPGAYGLGGSLERPELERPGFPFSPGRSVKRLQPVIFAAPSPHLITTRQVV